MGTLTLDTKKRRVRRKRIIVKNRIELTQTKQKPKPKAKTKQKIKAQPTEQKLKREAEKLLAEKKAKAKINTAKEKTMREARKLAIRVLNKKLKADYPVWDSYLPMQIGVAELIMDKFADIGCSRKAMRELINSHCNSRSYLENITKGKRYDLFTGDVVAEIEKTQRDNAKFRIGVYDKLSSKNAVAKKSSTGG